MLLVLMVQCPDYGITQAFFVVLLSITLFQCGVHHGYFFFSVSLFSIFTLIYLEWRQ